MRKYSDFFQTLHDEQSPTGNLGRGTHYSVLRAITFHDAAGRVLPEGKLCDFALIWDEDHDERIIEPIETIYRSGLLASFLFFGERKGSFTAILAEEVRDADRRSFLAARLEKIAEAIETDSWVAYVSSFGNPDNPIISDAADRVELYLSNLKMLWSLGLKAPPGPSRME